MNAAQSALVEDHWPSATAFLDLSNAHSITTDYATCTGIALCDDAGQPTRRFSQGQSAHIYSEYAITQPITVPSGGVEIHDGLGQLVHGKNTFQYGTTTPHTVPAGARLRFHQVIQLEIGTGEYHISVGLASVSIERYLQHQEGTLADEIFRQTAQELCRVMSVISFLVELDPDHRLLHHGMANLPGDCQIDVIPPPAPAADKTAAPSRWPVARLLGGAPWRSSLKHKAVAPAITHAGDAHTPPTIFHITHWKAGSQWINKIILDCVPDRVVAPQVGEGQFLYWPLQPGKVYPTVYITSQQFAAVQLPPVWRRFVIIRDLRDTLISAYFSLKISHPTELGNATFRNRLRALSFEEGLVLLMDEWLPNSTRIQLSWAELGERLIRYEDLLDHDLDILEPLLLDDCQLPVERERFQAAVLANRFEQITRGRNRGQEDITAHERKGIAGDWREHFSDNIKRKFKHRYGGALIATGYEHDFNW